MKEKIVSIITDYLNREETDYALMVNGAWGSGKTFFIKNTLKEKIEEIDCLKNGETKKTDENRKYKQVYVSLYGLSSIDEIKERIFYAINPNYKSVGFLLGKIGLFLENHSKGVVTKEDTDAIKEKFITYNDKIFFFDDLERINQRKIDVKSVLGYINFLVEHEHYKIVVIADDTKIGENYKHFKEKTIRFVCNYIPNLAEVFDDICKRYKGKYNEFLEEQKQSIVNTFQVGGCSNIRTLIFITDLYQKIFEEVDKIGDDYSNEINRDLLLPFTIISIESKNGYSKEVLKDNLPKYINNFNELDFLFDDNQNISLGDTTSEKDSKKQDKDKGLSFAKYKRLKNKFTIIFYDELYDWIYDGYVSQDRVDNFVETIKKDYEDKLENGKRKNAKKLAEKIRNWTKLEDEEFEGVVKEVKNKVEEGYYKLFDLLGIYGAFIQIELMKVEGFSVTKEITDNFKGAIFKIMKDELYTPRLNMDIPSWDENDKYTELRNYTLELNDKNKGRNSIEEVLLNMIKDNKIVDFTNFISGIDNRTFFMEVSVHEIIENVVVSNNETKNIFLRALSVFFPENMVNPSRNDCRYLSEISSEIDEYIKKQNKRNIGFVIIERMKKYVDNVRTQYLNRLGNEL